MPNLKLTELPTLCAINFDNTDLLYIVDTSGATTSRKITYKSLAGDKFSELTAYDSQNTSNVLFLSSIINNNTAEIIVNASSSTVLDARIDDLSSYIDINTTDILLVSAQAYAQDTAGLVSDVLFLSSEIDLLSAANDTNEAGARSSIIALTSDVDFLSGQIDLKANIASPTFTGTPTAPTAGSGANTTQIATTEFVTAAVAGGSSDGFIPSTYTGQDSLSAPNGLITKFGTVTIPSDSEVTVTFPASFPNGFVFGVASFSSAFSVTDDAGIGVNSGSTTSMVVRNGAGGSQTASWMAIGY